MFPIGVQPYAVIAIAFFLAIGLTYLVRELAQKYGFVAKPKLDRWHKRPTALMGGVAIFFSTALIYLLFTPQTRESGIIMASSGVLFLVGLIDDLLQIKPY